MCVCFSVDAHHTAVLGFNSTDKEEEEEEEEMNWLGLLARIKNFQRHDLTEIKAVSLWQN